MALAHLKGKKRTYFYIDDADSSASSEDEVPLMKNVQQIPGFYYDTTKKKYFKIQSHTSNPQQALTTATIKSKKRKRKKKKVARKLNDKFKAQIHGKSLTAFHSQMQYTGDRVVERQLQHLTVARWTQRHLYTADSGDSLKQTLITSGGDLMEVHATTARFSKLDIGRPHGESLDHLNTVSLPVTSWGMFHMTEFHPNSVAVVVRSRAAAGSCEFMLATKMEDLTYKVNPFAISNFRCPDAWDMCSDPQANYSQLFVAHYATKAAGKVTLLDMKRGKPAGQHHLLTRVGCRLTTHASSPNVVYCGARDGSLSLLDFREKCNSHQLYQYGHFEKLSHETRSISSILSLGDGVTFAASHMTGMRSLFDMRMRRPLVIKKQEMMHNSVSCGRLKKDESGSYLTLSDHRNDYVHIWDSKNLKSLGVLMLDTADCGCLCELTSRCGSLCLLTMHGNSYSLYS